MKRQIIKIDEEKCNGCGLCIPNCPEGALKIIDGKARLISDLFCDGLGACIGHCPQGAITFEEREAQEYDERKVMENILKQGENVVREHLRHLKDHNQKEFLKEALDYLKEKGIKNPIEEEEMKKGVFSSPGCPGSRMQDFKKEEAKNEKPSDIQSQLRQWPIQLHLVSPAASYYQRADVLLSADCVAYALASFHRDYLKGKSLAIACPKLDAGQDVYVEKIKALIDEAKINTLTVMIMQVPCCRGLLSLAQTALTRAKRSDEVRSFGKVPLKSIVVSLQGDIVSEEWVSP